MFFFLEFWLVFVKVEGDRGQEPGRIRAGDRPEAGGGGAGCGSHVRGRQEKNEGH